MLRLRLAHRCSTAVLAGFLGLVVVTPAKAQFWTDWQTMIFNSGLGSAAGSMTFSGLEVATVSYSGQVMGPSQTSCGYNYFQQSHFTAYQGSYTPPPPCDMIAITGGTPSTTHRIAFSRPVVDPFLAIVSLGQGGVAVRYDFNAPFDIIDEGYGAYGDGSLSELAGDILEGREGHGVLRFQGTFTELTWTAGPSEYWHGFNVGAASLYNAPTDPSVVPEPMSMALLGTGLAGVAGAARRRRRKQEEAEA